MDQPVEKNTKVENEHNTYKGLHQWWADDRVASVQNHLLSDSGFQIQMADSNKLVDGKAYIEAGNKGQYFEKTDLDKLGKEVSDYLLKVAQDTSKANNGAEINVSAGLAAAYLPHHQHADAGLYADAKAGSGALEANAVMPDQKDLDEHLKAIFQKFEKDVKGDYDMTWPGLSIVGDLGIRDSNKYSPLLAESKFVDNQPKPKK